MTAPTPDMTEAIDAAGTGSLGALSASRTDVEQIVRAAAEVLVPQVQAAERERIAQAIEAEREKYVYRTVSWLNLTDAARITRGEP